MIDKTADDLLKEKVGQLPKEMTPSRDLWLGIEHAISQKPKGLTKFDTTQSALGQSFTSSMSFAFAQRLNSNVVLISSLAASFLVIALYFGQVTPKANIETPVDLVALMQNEFTQNKNALLVSLGQPELKNLSQDMQEQFTQLTKAQNAIKKALEDDPNNVDLLNLLKWTQQQELALLKQLYSPRWQTI